MVGVGVACGGVRRRWRVAGVVGGGRGGRGGRRARASQAKRAFSAPDNINARKQMTQVWRALSRPPR
jgi:hypothetical protein